MILADTSNWIDHFRLKDLELQRIIEEDLLLCHPFVIGELALGSIRDRSRVLAFLGMQQEPFLASHEEVMLMIERHGLFSMGIGYTDAHLIAAGCRCAAVDPGQASRRGGRESQGPSAPTASVH